MIRYAVLQLTLRIFKLCISVANVHKQITHAHYVHHNNISAQNEYTIKIMRILTIAL